MSIYSDERHDSRGGGRRRRRGDAPLTVVVPTPRDSPGKVVSPSPTEPGPSANEWDEV